MANYELITTVQPRVSQYPEHRVTLPYLARPPLATVFSGAYLDWWQKYEWWINYRVRLSDLPEAKTLSRQLIGLGLESPEAQPIIARLRELSAPSYDEKTPLQIWAHMAWQLPKDQGAGHFRGIIAEILSEKYFGKVLETMSGYNSYFRPSRRRRVTALDYCREALERYPYPKRRRILFDLNEVDQVDDIPFCQPHSFDAAVICFGFRYLASPIPVCWKLHRLLKPGGKIVFVENPKRGYEDLVRRDFSSTSCAQVLLEAGFEQIETHELGEEYYLIEATMSAR